MCLFAKENRIDECGAAYWKSNAVVTKDDALRCDSCDVISKKPLLRSLSNQNADESAQDHQPHIAIICLFSNSVSLFVWEIVLCG